MKSTTAIHLVTAENMEDLLILWKWVSQLLLIFSYVEDVHVHIKNI